MTEIQILFQLKRFYGKVMTLEQALEAMGRITFTMETFDEEEHEYDKTQLILDIGDAIMDEGE
jgi:hypothetical protein